MKIVIEIDKKAFDYIMACSFVEDEAVMLNQSLEDRIKTLMFFDVLNAIKSGTPLPKGHGDLIDKSKIYKAIPAEEDNCTGMGMSLDEMDGYNEGIDVMYSLVQDAPTIIEADKED